MRKNDGWLNALFALVFIAVPALVGYYFLLPDWANRQVVSFATMWGIAFGFAMFVALLSLTLILTKVLSIESLNFNIPLTLVFMALFLSYDLPLYARLLIVVALILTAFPINMLVSNIKRSLIKRNKRK